MIISEIIKRAMLAGLGAQEKAKEFVDDLVKAGELSKSDGAALVKEWASKAEESSKDIDKKVRDAITGAMEKLNMPSRDDIQNLEKKVKDLSARLQKRNVETPYCSC